MRPISLLILSIVFASCTTDSSILLLPVDTTPNKVLVEVFSNYRCPYCPPAGSYLSGIHDLNGNTLNDTNVIILRMHTTLYPGDPFYEHNVTDNNARQTFYSAGNANPRGFLLGIPMGTYDSTSWTSKINNKLSLPRFFKISLVNAYNSINRTGNIEVNLDRITLDSIEGELRLHIALAENNLYYNAPNGETRFDGILRDLITYPHGDTVRGINNTRSFPYAIENTVDHDNSFFIVFLQSNESKEIYAVEKIKIIP